MRQQLGSRSRFPDRWRHILRLLVRLRQDTGGGVLLITAVALPVLLGAGAIGIDLSHLYVVRNRVQTAADSGALAGALALGQNLNSYQTACRRANTYVRSNMGVNAPDNDRFLSVELGVWSANEFQSIATCDFQASEPVASSEFKGQPRPVAVRVQAGRVAEAGNPVKLSLAVTFDRRLADVRARAVAARSSTGLANVCMLALGGDFVLNGGTELDLNCSLATNATMKPSGKTPDKRSVASVIFDRFEGSGSDNPADFFKMTGQEKDIDGPNLERPFDPDNGSLLSNQCNNKKDCVLKPGIYKINNKGKNQNKGTFKEFAKKNISVDGKGAVQIYATGDMVFNGQSISFNGCFSFVAGGQIRTNGKIGITCDTDDLPKVPVDGDTEASVRLVQ